MKKLNKMIALLTVVSMIAMSGVAAYADTTDGNVDSNGITENPTTQEGATTVAEHEHVWEEVTESAVEATCTTKGSKAYKCIVEGCTETKTDVIDEIDHTYGDDGKCTVCGAEAPVNNGNVTTEEGDENTSANEIATIDDLKAAFSKGGSYKLVDNLEVNEKVQVDATVNLDLNGYTVTAGANSPNSLIYIGVNGDLTVGNGTMSTVENHKNYIFGNVYGGNLTINDGTYNAYKYLVANEGTAESTATITIAGGTFANTANSYSFNLKKYSETYVNAGTFNVTYGISMLNNTIATVETSGHSVVNGYGYENLKYKLTDEEYATPVKLVWGIVGSNSGPTMNANGPAIYGNFFNSATDVTINSGSVVSQNSTAVYQPQQGTFTMNGGLLQGATAIDAKMGNFTFYGGYVIGTGTANDGGFESALGGTTANGSAISLQLGYYGADDNDPGARGPINQQAVPNNATHLPANNDFSLTINGGVFISKNNAPITATNWNMCQQNVSYSISAGRFSSFPKTVEMKHGENDGVTPFTDIPKNNTVDTVYNYIQNGDYRFAPAAYYDGVSLDYGYTGADAAYYASMSDAIADRNNDPDARAYIYYLLDNGLSESGNVDRQLQIFYSLDNCGSLIPENVGMGTTDAAFEYSFVPTAVSYNASQYVLTDSKDDFALWSPAVTYDANGGTFGNNVSSITVLATVATGLYTGTNYGYVVDDSTNQLYVTYDELGNAMITPSNTILTNPQNPTNGNLTFLGWYYEDGSAFDPATTQIKENVTVYARWQGGSTPVPTPTPTPTPTPDPQPLPDDDPLVDPDEPVVDPENPTDPTDPQPLPDDDPLVIDPSDSDTAKENPDQPKTGDESEIILYLLIALGAAGTLGFTVRKKETNEANK